MEKPLDIEAFLNSISPKKELEMACTSAYYVISQRGPVTREEVIKYSGLCELNVARALKFLVKEESVIKIKNLYWKNVY